MSFLIRDITNKCSNPGRILFQIKDRESQRKDYMSRILLQKQDKTYKNQNDGKTQHPITKPLFFENFDIEHNKERSQGKKKPYGIDEIKFISLTIRMK